MRALLRGASLAVAIAAVVGEEAHRGRLVAVLP